jgi:hypothetical protein
MRYLEHLSRQQRLHSLQTLFRSTFRASSSETPTVSTMNSSSAGERAAASPMLL